MLQLHRSSGVNGVQAMAVVGERHWVPAFAGTTIMLQQVFF
jgi:hypothetical protein